MGQFTRTQVGVMSFSTRGRNRARLKGMMLCLVTAIAASALALVPSPAAAAVSGPVIAHVPPTTAYFGQDIPLAGTLTCPTAAGCSMSLSYRPTPNVPGLQVVPSGGWSQDELDPTGSQALPDGTFALTFNGTIPGAAVTTTGIDYFLEATDGESTSAFPGTPGLPVAGLPGAGAAYLHVHTVNPPVLAHVPPAYGYSDTALPVQLEATCSTGACGATLYWRTTDGPVIDEPLVETPDWPQAEMAVVARAPLAPVGERITFAGTVPADAVDTRGVDYFFEVTDGSTTSWWPGTSFQGYYAPRDGMRTGFHHVHVLEPSHVVHTPVLTAPYRQNIGVAAQGTCPVSRSCSATLYYRTTQRTVADPADDFAAVAMAVARTGASAEGNDVISLTGAIPSAVVDTRGVDYFFSVTDGTTTTWWPGTSHVDGYVPVEGTRVAYHHIRVLEPPHITHVPLGATPALQPATISAFINCATEACSAALHFTTDLQVSDVQGAAYTTVAMAPTGAPTASPIGQVQQFQATIPASEVTTRGLGYFIEASDGYTRSYAPGTSYWGAYLPVDGQRPGAIATAELLPTGVTVGTGGSDDNTTVIEGSVGFNLQAGLAYPVRVLEPAHIVHTPVGVADFNQPLSITARSNCSSPTCSARLEWQTASGSWAQQAMVASALTPHVAPLGSTWQYTASIPRRDVTLAGFSYRISVTDGYTEETSPTYPVVVTNDANLGTIGDQVWLDSNRNGVREPAERGVPSVRMSLDAAGLDGLFGTLDDRRIGTQLSDDDGSYDFNRLLQGRYRLTFDSTSYPAGAVVVSGSATRIIDLALRQDYNNGDLGLRFAGTISGRAFTDDDEDGVLDAAEVGRSGVEIELLSAGPDGVFQTADDLAVANTSTSATGGYSFEELPHGPYRARAEIFSAGPRAWATTPTARESTVTTGAPVIVVNYGFLDSVDRDADGIIDQVERQFFAASTSGDTDGDGLTDYFEIRTGGLQLRPDRADTDADGVGDLLEDLDSDGLTNSQEQAAGTSATLEDTDDDGLNDATETNGQTDPTRPDTDDDGLSDSDEQATATSPVDPDSDDDTVLDGADVLTSTAAGPGGLTVTLTGVGNLSAAITIDELSDPVTSAAPGRLSDVIDLTMHSGAAFDTATVAIPYPPDVSDASALWIMWFDEDLQLWVPAADGQTVDSTAHTVSAQLEHFSIYALFDAHAYTQALASVSEPCGPRQDENGNVIPVDTALVLDSSGSMSGSPIQLARTSARQFVDGMLDDDRSAVVDFDSTSTLRHPLSTDRTSLKAAIDAIDASGGTNIGAGVDVGLDELEANSGPTHIRTMVLLTDGYGRYDTSLTQRAFDASIRIHAIGLGGADEALLRSIADGTGGTYHDADTASQLPEAFADIQESIADQGLDRDGDHLSDCDEVLGVTDAAGYLTFASDPDDPDSDDDGLIDGDETGPKTYWEDIAELFDGLGFPVPLPASGSYHPVFSDPELPDTDGDTLGDPEELDFGSRARSNETDGDNLSDAFERQIGTNPASVDTDDDGYDDNVEVERVPYGFDPVFYDRGTTIDEYMDALIAAYAEDEDHRLNRTTAYFNGLIALGEYRDNEALHINFVSIVDGYLRGTFNEEFEGQPPADPPFVDGDIGDVFTPYTVANLTYRDHPFFGGDDPILFLHGIAEPHRLPATVDRFLGPNPEKIEEVTRILGLLEVKSDVADVEDLRAELASVVASIIDASYGSTDEFLLAYGFSQDGLDRLTTDGQTDLDVVADTIRGQHHEDETGPGEFWDGSRHWAKAERYVRNVLYPATNTLSRTLRAPGFGSGNSNIRYADHLDDNLVAHEVKTGYVRYTERLRRQIAKDAALIAQGTQISDAHWHFFPSGISDTVGADPRVIDELEQHGIPYTIHTGENTFLE